MANADDSVIHLIHTVWSGALTLLVAVIGWFMRWNWNRIVTELDGKADRETVLDVKADFERRHKETLDMMKEIKEAITKNDAEATQVRNSLSATLQSLVGQMGEIKGWIQGSMNNKAGGP